MKKVIMFTILIGFLFMTLLPLAHADDSDVNILNIPQQVANGLGLDLFSAQLLVSTVVMIFCLLPVLFGCRMAKSNPTIPCLFIGFPALGFLVAVDWLPYWILIMIVIITGLMFSGSIRNWITGHGGKD